MIRKRSARQALVLSTHSLLVILAVFVLSPVTTAEESQETKERLEWLTERKSQLMDELNRIDQEIAEIEHAHRSDDQYPRISGELSGVSEKQKEMLLRLAAIAGDSTVLSVEVFKNQEFLCVDLGAYPFTFNSLQLDQTRRVAKLLKEKLLTTVRAFAAVIRRGGSNLTGVKIKVVILHKEFSNQASPASDHVEMYFSTALVSDFSDTEITSQQLVDRSVLIANGNRIGVSLQ